MRWVLKALLKELRDGLEQILIGSQWRLNRVEVMCKESHGSSPSGVAERSSALDSSSGVVRMWVRIPAWPVAALVSLSKTLNHNCFVLRMGRKAIGSVCCVMHVKEPRTLIVKEKGLAPVFLVLRLEHPAGWICARYKSSVLLLLSLSHESRRSSPSLSHESF